jgi:hypothetical protein
MRESRRSRRQSDANCQSNGRTNAMIRENCEDYVEPDQTCSIATNLHAEGEGTVGTGLRQEEYWKGPTMRITIYPVVRTSPMMRAGTPATIA